ncbi:hypothetical protein F5Y16DRAFT_287148 [Xylariaceae sp. FL0255]|nr:hypothetical protein F5Y16DRAFT_287148 [Xylariaceae sp. FL0255]
MASTPYWGQLPSAKARRSSLDPSIPSQDSNRTSTQSGTTDSTTFSPLASPTVPPGGLGPRPPSLPYGQLQYSPDSPETRRKRLQKRQQQPTIDRDEESPTSPPPAAPEVPRAPPVSYRNRFENTYNSSPRSARQQMPFTAEPESFYKDVTPPAERQTRQPVLDRKHKNFDDSLISAQQLEKELVRSGSLRRPSQYQQSDAPTDPTRRESLNPATQRNMWAADRSPLQKLELTLDGITKEEKRARVEAAERRARERAARVSASAGTADLDKPLPKPPSNQRTRDVRQPVEHSIVTDPIPAKPSAAAQYSSQDGRLYGSSEGSPRSQIPVPKQRSVSAAESSGFPQRNLSFRERAVSNNIGLPQQAAEEPAQDSTPTSPSRIPTLARSGSNKLKKNPPGDPWYNARTEAEERAAAYNRLNSLDKTQDTESDLEEEAPVKVSNSSRKISALLGEEAPRPPARGKPVEDAYDQERPSRFKGFAAAIGLGRNNSTGTHQQSQLSRETSGASTQDGQHMQDDDFDSSPTQQRGLATAVGFGRANSINLDRQRPAPVQPYQDTEQGDRGSKSVKFQDGGHTAGLSDEEATDAGHEQHHFRDQFHRDHYKPGHGMYNPPAYLNEWEKAVPGVLSGSLLDLREEPAVAADKSTAWWEGPRRPSHSAPSRKAETLDVEYDDNQTRTKFTPPLYLRCGPLLRYCGMRQESPISRAGRGNSTADKEIWRGSVMIVTQDSESSYDVVPVLRLFVQPIELLEPPPAEISEKEPLRPEYVDPIAGIPKIGREGETLYVRPVEHLEEAKDVSMMEPDDGLFEVTRSAPDFSVDAPDPPGSFTSRKKRTPIDGESLNKFHDIKGIRLHAERGCTFWRFSIEVDLRDQQQRIAYRINRGPATGFWVPARGESMNIMFHSCNGFSLSVNPDEFSGPDPMWRDVLNNHQTRPFHVMIGGGDQVYHDAVMVKSRLFREWLQIKNPLHKNNAPFTAEMQDELEAFYLDRYMMWFSRGLFGLANSQIPMVNMYDDHDIIDGFGSYPQHLMKSPVFSGLGNVAFKYYMLFQHQSLPTETEDTEPSWCLGIKPGPYINERSRSMFMSLGSSLALLAVDCRTERTRDDIIREDSWSKLMDRCYSEIVKGKTQHLLVLLGVPIAYPRLVWLENILTSRFMDPIKALGKFGLLNNFLNKFDGGVEVLDDLDDHWTAKNHKDERRFVVEDLQDLAADKSVRITILSGDVHLAAVGQFYSNPKLRIPKHKDFRYMPNIVSSAIVNTPPPDFLADFLNKRNKVHHFDKTADESMIPIFSHGVDGKPRNNKNLLPHRNWCSIRQYVPGHTPPPTPPPEEFEYTPPGTPPQRGPGSLLRRLSLSKKRGPALRPDVPNDGNDRSRPPLSGGGFMRSFSRRGSTSGASEGPGSNGLMRTLSLGSRPRNLFRRNSSKKRPDDGGINGTWGDDEDEDDTYAAPPQRRGPHPAFVNGDTLNLRGGAFNEYEVGDEEQFSARPPRRATTLPVQKKGPPPTRPGRQNSLPISEGSEHWADAPPRRPFHRTPTGLSLKKLARNGPERYEVNLEGGLDICLNVEVNAKDPAGITVPYRLLVPKLWYEYEGEDAAAAPAQGLQGPEAGTQAKPVTGLRRLFSRRSKVRQRPQHEEDYQDYEEDEYPEGEYAPESSKQESW